MAEKNFLTLLQKKESDSPVVFLSALEKENIADYNEYLLFNLTQQTDSFYQNLDFLADDDVWIKEELTPFTLVAQTIDNDYLLATDTSVLVIPYNLYKKDSETFHQSIWAFMTSYVQGNNPSNILA